MTSFSSSSSSSSSASLSVPTFASFGGGGSAPSRPATWGDGLRLQQRAAVDAWIDDFQNRHDAEVKALVGLGRAGVKVLIGKSGVPTVGAKQDVSDNDRLADRMRTRLGLTSVVFGYGITSDAGQTVTSVTVTWGGSTSSSPAISAPPLAPDAPTFGDAKQTSLPSTLDAEAAYRVQVGAMLDVFCDKIRTESRVGDHRRHTLWPALVAQTAVWRQTSTAATRRASAEVLRALKPGDEKEWSGKLTRLVDAADGSDGLASDRVWLSAPTAILLADLLRDCDLAAKTPTNPPGGAPVADVVDKSQS